jgi:S-adenosyl-L-methionine hydrolase (adenosine-forming)
MPVITLTTDWGLKDHYVSAVKGQILSHLPEAHIIDISHLVPSFDIVQSSFIFLNSYKNFPAGTVHIIGVNSIREEESEYVAIKHEGHFFVGCDNGFFSIIFQQKPDKIVELTSARDYKSTFPARDIFVKAACHLAIGGSLDDLGAERTVMNRKLILQPVIDGKVIRGAIAYVDAYKNLITNVTKDLFEQVAQGREFTIFFRSFEYELNRISSSYNEVDGGEKLALFNSSGYLEIAINKGPASTLLGLKNGDGIRIEFYDNQNS